jgi:hypothetical protein
VLLGPAASTLASGNTADAATAQKASAGNVAPIFCWYLRMTLWSPCRQRPNC